MVCDDVALVRECDLGLVLPFLMRLGCHFADPIPIPLFVTRLSLQRRCPKGGMQCRPIDRSKYRKVIEADTCKGALIGGSKALVEVDVTRQERSDHWVRNIDVRRLYRFDLQKGLC